MKNSHLIETEPSEYAYLFDRVAASNNDPPKRMLQRYGAQGGCTGRVWTPLPMEDPAHLDERRATVGLKPEADYISQVQIICEKLDDLPSNN